MVESVTMVNGERLTDVRALVQSPSGFIWLATSKGLVRYDGTQVKRFSHQDDKQNSLSYDDVRDMVIDEQGYLWIITRGGGLNRFDPSTESFLHFRYQSDNNDSLDSDKLNSIALASDNKLWIGSDVGINLFDRATFENQRLNQELLPADNNQSQYIQTIFEDEQQRLWFAVRRQGLYLHIPQTKRTLHFSKGEENSQAQHAMQGQRKRNFLDSNVVSEIYQASNGDIWIGTALSINRFNPNTLDFDRFDIPLKPRNKVNHASVTSIYQDLQGDLWVGTFYNGVSVLKQGSNQLVNINHGGNIEHSLNSMQINDIYQDSQGVLWFVTPRNGLYKLLAKSMVFDHQLVFAQPTLQIELLYTDDTGRLWMTSGSQIFVYEHLKQQFSLFIDMDKFLKLSENEVETIKKLQILSIFRHKERNIVVKIDSLGIFSIDIETKTVNPIRIKNGLNSEDIDLVIKATDGELWITSKQHGLWNAAINEDSAGELTIELEQVDTSISGKQLIAAVDGITVLTHKNQIVSYNTSGKAAINIPQDIEVNQLYIDHQQRIWLATQLHGLALWQDSAQRWQFFGRNNGLQSQTIYSVTEDSEHQLWLTDGNGISQFNINTATATNFAADDGIRFNSWLDGLAAQLPLGDVVFAGKVGVYSEKEQTNQLGQFGVLRFSPNKLLALNQQDSDSQSILFTDFKLFNKTAPLQSVDSKSPLTTTINQMAHLELTYLQNWFSIAFSSDKYQQSQSFKYAYMLEGLSDQWITVTADNNIASFTSVAPGDYLFKVKMADDSSNTGMRVLPITITPPWWRTSWAYALYFIGIVIFLLFISFLRTRQLRQRAAELELGIAERTEQLKQRADTISLLLKEKEGLLEDKDRLIANISHEFRTPLTLILGPLDQQLRQNATAESVSQLKLAQINANRLLYMVDQLLDLARLKNANEAAKLSKNVAEVCQFLIESFRPIALSRDIKLKFINGLDENVWVLFQPDGLEKVISNLLTNAFKYSPNNAKIDVSLRRLNDKVEISVKDSGQGMSEHDLKRIFQRFERLKTDKAHAPGAGIGLALVKELLEIHQGEISVSSVVNQGSEFVVSLPIMTEQQLNQLENQQVNTAVVEQQLEYVDTSLVSESIAETEVTAASIDSESKAKLLIIEDNQDMRQYIVSCLSASYECEQAADGEQGLALAQASLPDLIICDVMMPKMDGFEVTGSLKTNTITNHIPVILLTARGDKESRHKGWSQKADEFLEKPFNTEELLLRIANLLSIRQLLRQRFQQEFITSQADESIEVDPISQAPTQPCSSTVEQQEQQVDPVHQAFLQQINAVLEQYYHQSDFDVARFAVEMALSHRQLGRKTKALLDITPAEALRHYRLGKAAELLREGKAPSVVSHKVGFATHSYFSQCFKARYNCLPSQFCRSDEK